MDTENDKVKERDAFAKRKAKWLELRTKLENYSPSKEDIQNILEAEEDDE